MELWIDSEDGKIAISIKTYQAIGWLTPASIHTSCQYIL